jgi:hypothetical protein
MESEYDRGYDRGYYDAITDAASEVSNEMDRASNINTVIVLRGLASRVRMLSYKKNK